MNEGDVTNPDQFFGQFFGQFTVTVITLGPT